ncbi:MAG: AmmeMemoRadiSam system protein B [Myxococcota bacterium]
MGQIRRPAVAGTFYPGSPEELEDTIGACLAAAGAPGEAPPKAVIAPHAGYVYSGPVAGSAYARLAPLRGQIERVVLLGPAHRVPCRALAVPACDAFATPLGPVALDREALERALALPQVEIFDAAHAEEHSLEVHLPFLQTVLGEFRLAPFVVGDAAPQEVDEVLELLWGGSETLLVVSSDLSHYHDYATARRMDAETTRAIEALEPEAIGYEQACGRIPVQGLLLAARRHGLCARAVDVRSSGDTAGPRDRVVGYGSYVLA